MEANKSYTLEKEIESKYERILGYIESKFNNKCKVSQCSRGDGLNKESYIKPFKNISLEIFIGYCTGIGRKDKIGHFEIVIVTNGNIDNKEKFKFNINNAKLTEVEKEMHKYIDYILC